MSDFFNVMDSVTGYLNASFQSALNKEEAKRFWRRQTNFGKNHNGEFKFSNFLNPDLSDKNKDNPVVSLQNSGVDFFTNMFSVFFVKEPKGQYSVTSDGHMLSLSEKSGLMNMGDLLNSKSNITVSGNPKKEDYLSYTFVPNYFVSRIDTVEIPLPNIKTTQYNHLGMTYEKALPFMNFNRKLTMNIRMDEALSILGTVFIFSGIYSEMTQKYIMTPMPPNTVMSLPKLFDKKDDNIINCYVPLYLLNKKTVGDYFYDNEKDTFGKRPYCVFTDIRFISLGDSLPLKQGGADVVTQKLTLIFKDMKTSFFEKR